MFFSYTEKIAQVPTSHEPDNQKGIFELEVLDCWWLQIWGTNITIQLAAECLRQCTVTALSDQTFNLNFAQNGDVSWGQRYNPYGTRPKAGNFDGHRCHKTNSFKALRHFSLRFCNVLDVTLMRMSQCPLDAGVHSVMVKPTSLGFADRASRRAVWISATKIDNTDLDENERRMRGNQLWASRWRGWLWKRSRMQGSVCACNVQIQIELRYRTW